ncbi:2Fe-2S iron-sulfur cluster-binding protein [Tepidibacillus sp. LV47]|uniref:2Fe-2S iron-sulfur cluster-binding protein n=1 Tax=Tepidibacillus sp. LV47 TaxID=3398228 RepID=UPI003AB0E557
MSVIISFFPNNKKIEVKPGTTILKAAIKADIHLAHKCGGKGACLTCKVKVEDPSKVLAPSKIEQRKLGPTYLQQGMRLGCQTKVLASVKIEIPEDPLKAAIRKQLAKQREQNFDD